MAGSSRNGPFCSSVEITLRERISDLYAMISAKDVALQKANEEIKDLRQQLEQSRLSNRQSTLVSEVGTVGPTSHLDVTAQSVSSLVPFALTAEEWSLFDNVVKTWDCRSSVGNIQWLLVAQKFANAANNVTIFARDKDRLQSSYRNLSSSKKAELNALVTAKLATNILQEPSSSIPTVSQTASSSSITTAHTETTITNTLPSQSITIQKSKIEIAFSQDERAKIKEWGIARKKMIPPQDVTEKYLYKQHINHFYQTLHYGRKGCELKNVWDSWWKDNKSKCK